MTVAYISLHRAMTANRKKLDYNTSLVVTMRAARTDKIKQRGRGKK